VRLLLLLVFIAFTGNLPTAFAQEKKPAKKKLEKKKPAASQDWGRFNTKAQGDLEKHEKKAAKAK
jgi:Na+-transporting methylmalonyl-CoA/oxaloacetate decarboxylase gamma subunit